MSYNMYYMWAAASHWLPTCLDGWLCLGLQPCMHVVVSFEEEEVSGATERGRTAALTGRPNHNSKSRITALTGRPNQNSKKLTHRNL